MTATTQTTVDARASATVAGTTTMPRLTTRETGRATVSDSIDVSQQAWAEVDRLTTLAEALEVERDAVRKLRIEYETAIAERDAARRERDDLMGAYEKAAWDLDAARARVDELERTLATVTNRLAEVDRD